MMGAIKYLIDRKLRKRIIFLDKRVYFLGVALVTTDVTNVAHTRTIYLTKSLC